ncbi:hypothetical protein PISMIDRAFT_25293 [Pisolithus microcarpus 441]|uniref:Uncharacterized protein n=1 Tax=Pisolithus microcarpus 441 TaxID=765257 RepID=A0A0C9YF23_9AGAM|nr:hypothetical protein PISMIDRAFT_25293 [Pisolithus microcarpus 441]
MSATTNTHQGTTGIAIVVGTTKDVEDVAADKGEASVGNKDKGKGKEFQGSDQDTYQEGHPKKTTEAKKKGRKATLTTLDYALVTVMDNSHLVVDLGSLRGAQSLTEPKFMSHVKWLQGAATMKATLYKGNCCVTYMQEHLPLVKVLNQDELTALTLANRLSYVMHAPHEDAFKKANQIVKEDGVWLNHVDCASIETNLAGNQLLPIYLDSENDFFNMMMNVLLQMPLVQSQHKYIDTTLSMVKLVTGNSNLAGILQHKDMSDTLFELFKSDHSCSCENTKSGLSMSGIAKWYPTYALGFPEGSHIPAAFKPEYLCLAGKLWEPVSVKCWMTSSLWTGLTSILIISTRAMHPKGEEDLLPSTVEYWDMMVRRAKADTQLLPSSSVAGESDDTSNVIRALMPAKLKVLKMISCTACMPNPC